MAMQKLKQAIGLPISDAELLDLLKKDFDAKDPGYDHSYAEDMTHAIYNHPETDEYRSYKYGVRDPYTSEMMQGPFFDDGKGGYYLSDVENALPDKGDLEYLAAVIQENEGGLLNNLREEEAKYGYDPRR
jgi:hypothetical protein